MPGHALTNQPTEITGLNADTLYAVQNQTVGRFVKLARASAAPQADSDDVYLVPPRTDTDIGEVGVRLDAGEKLYAWGNGGPGRIFVDEAP